MPPTQHRGAPGVLQASALEGPEELGASPPPLAPLPPHPSSTPSLSFDYRPLAQTLHSSPESRHLNQQSLGQLSTFSEPGPQTSTMPPLPGSSTAHWALPSHRLPQPHAHLCSHSYHHLNALLPLLVRNLLFKA